MINCSPVKSVYYSSATSKLNSKKIKKSQITNRLMARSATTKLEQLTPVSSPEQQNNQQQSSPLCSKMQFNEDYEEDSSSKSEMCNHQVIKNECEQLNEQILNQTTSTSNSSNANHQTATPQSPLSNSSSPSPRQDTSKLNHHNSASNDAHLINSSSSLNGNLNCLTNQLVSQQQLNSPHSPAVSISSTCSSLTNGNATTKHGINDILMKKNSAELNSSSNLNNNNSANNLIDNHLSVFAAVASAAAANNGLASSTFTNSSPKLANTTTGNQLAHATSALAAAVANRFYFNNSNNNSTTSSSNNNNNSTSSQCQNKTNNQSNLNSINQNNSNTGNNNLNNNATTNNTSPRNTAAALKLNLNDLSSRQFYWQQMVQNQALWQERFSAAVSNVTNGTNNAYSNLNSPLANSSLLNHCNGQTTPAQSTNLDSSFNCKFVFFICIYLESIYIS